MSKPKQLRITLATKDTVTIDLTGASFWSIAYAGALMLYDADGVPTKAYAHGTWLVAEVVS